MKHRPPGLRLVENPPNPWGTTHVDYLPAEDDVSEAPVARLEVIEDRARSILAKNDSPDLGFRWSVNPYRGCFHACAYCYARPGHEYLSFGAGSDFDRKIVLKPDAPALLRDAFEKPSWKGEFILFSGDTDCYQPLEASYGLTKGCLGVCLEYANPCAVITKSPLVERDVELLAALSKATDFGVTISIPFWDRAKAKAIEPYVATPQRRVQTIAALARAGVKVGVNVAPMIPGLGDEDMAHVLEAAAEAGATRAGCVFLRLPGSVKDVFVERLRAALPLRAEKVLARIREARGGKLYDCRFGVRQRGEGRYAEATLALFEATCKRLGLATGPKGSGAPTTFRRPPKKGSQLDLFRAS